MAVTQRLMRGVEPRVIFDVLRDGNSYAGWVVGTRKIRAVEPGWPAEGTRLHYTVGYWPFRKDDETRSMTYTPERQLALEAHAWPAGTAMIQLRTEPVDGGTLVRIEEHPNAGLAKTLHNPVLDVLIGMRNVETLRRLERLAARR